MGVLDAFMDSKGMITPEEWRTFCSDAVLLARFPKYNYQAGELFEARIELSYFRRQALDGLQLKWEIQSEQIGRKRPIGRESRPASDPWRTLCECRGSQHSHS
ncbi:hypothetical protein Q0F98_35525 [Paenibacillus amylolyticus]|nr:hypothetical protein Q0F98_35525 [Paenibacillus amylolyticus]